MPSFGAKRKPRKIEVDEDEDEGVNAVLNSTKSANTYVSGKPLVTGHRAFKKSSLRKSIVADDEQNEEETGTDTTTLITEAENGERGDNGGLNQSSIGRSASTSKKKKVPLSRLSFGVEEIISDDTAEILHDNEMFTPKKATLGRRVIESNTLRKTFPAYTVSLRGEEDVERPIYSKDYLNELKISTPSTPKDLPALSVTLDDEDYEGLDASELEGAMIVDMGRSDDVAHIPTEAEIREKKDRRARLAVEQDFISLNSDGDDRQQLSLLPRKKKLESRLVRDDEDVAEGFDEFIDDGRISLGKKAEREAKKRQRAAMAEMIHDAEGSSSNESDDSERERLAAFESAQTRAGMDGLVKPDPASTLYQILPKITPLPSLNECLQRLHTTLNGMQQELTRRTAKMAELQQEKQEILVREQEVQRLLKEAGDRYAAMRAENGLPAVDAKLLMEGENRSLDPLRSNRGLESFGNTPTGRPLMDDVG